MFTFRGATVCQIYIFICLFVACLGLSINTYFTFSNKEKRQVHTSENLINGSRPVLSTYQTVHSLQSYGPSVLHHPKRGWSSERGG